MKVYILSRTDSVKGCERLRWTVLVLLTLCAVASARGASKNNNNPQGEVSAASSLRFTWHWWANGARTLLTGSTYGLARVFFSTNTCCPAKQVSALSVLRPRPLALICSLCSLGSGRRSCKTLWQQVIYKCPLRVHSGHFSWLKSTVICSDADRHQFTNKHPSVWSLRHPPTAFENDLEFQVSVDTHHLCGGLRVLRGDMLL